MNLLFSNDKRGTYPDSWYAATADFLPEQPELRGAQRADVCIIGAGYTGLSAALHLAERGFNVVVLEAHRLGFGASGRNGGQLGSGQRVEQPDLERLVGRDDARLLWNLGQEAKQITKGLIAKHKIDCHLKSGVAWAANGPRDFDHLRNYADHMAAHYEYPLELHDANSMRTICPSPAYHGGIVDMDAGHLHPFRYVLGLARAALAAGVTIHERSHVHHIKTGTETIVRTDRGHIRADHIILATNGYTGGLNKRISARVMPINNFIIATEPLGTDAARILTRDIAVADCKFVVNYFRLSHDGRLLFGGGENYGYHFPSDIAEKVRGPMAQIFPHLKDVTIDYAWGGTLGITMKRLPYVARVAPNMMAAAGYSGHGVGTATHAGYVMAEAIAGQAEGFDTLSRLPVPAFPGGGMMRSPLLKLAMAWYVLRDRLGL